jgi:1,4-alpha-glucan branching enzyme
MTLSPPLVSMMTDELLIGRYHQHLHRLIELARRETERTKREQPHLEALAWWYLQEFEEVRRLVCDDWRSDVRGAFRRHQDTGRLEILTCAATHGFLPLMDPVPQAVRAQIYVGAQHYRKHFGRDASGIWLPECGYVPGHEVYLKEVGCGSPSSRPTA